MGTSSGTPTPPVSSPYGLTGEVFRAFDGLLADVGAFAHSAPHTGQRLSGSGSGSCHHRRGGCSVLRMYGRAKRQTGHGTVSGVGTTRTKPYLINRRAEDRGDLRWC